MKTLGWNVGTLNREWKSIELCIHLNITKIASEKSLNVFRLVKKDNAVQAEVAVTVQNKYYQYFLQTYGSLINSYHPRRQKPVEEASVF